MEVERVQVIASLSSHTIPAEFVMPETEQPVATTFRGPIPEIPVIDLSDPDEENLVCRIAEASREWGFFQAVNHGIPTEVIRRLQEAGTEFFGLPQEEKEVYAKPEDAKSIEGYGTKHQKIVNGKKPWGDHLFHRIWPPSRINYQFWPKNPPSYREVNEEYGTHVRGFADKVFRSLSLGLGLEADAMKEAFGGEELEYMLKINYYPPCPRPDLTFGVLEHTDMSTLTILVPNEVPGLQVLKDNHWIDAKYVPNAIIVHMGDQIEVASNGYYKSVLHRTTVNKEKARMSWPVFLEPPPEFVVGPIPQLLNDQNPPKYKSKMFKDYAYCKLNKLPQ
ncbi:Flavonol synthase/flavanone 3-hydroxylase [Morus notabilis]|uniref:Flavonol synthase/flavanone 3-hydroxylase n=1 Tax=Morus notabilis TaxID=981085 RepID=W9QQT0_9ROSA|nr:flavonol synthase/flavanone 3-hydroxylase [Morus notabilis]EXB51040.1 Flavonol synthase/flavanone 3-hydroxylase [Morus notabilis]